MSINIDLMPKLLSLFLRKFGAKEKREELINKLRGVQLILASGASQADATYQSALGLSNGRPSATRIYFFWIHRPLALYSQSARR